MTTAALDAVSRLTPVIVAALPPGWAYALVLFQPGTDGVTSVSSNATWPGLVTALHEAGDWVARVHGDAGDLAPTLIQALHHEIAELRQELDEVTDREREAHRWESR